MTQIDTRCICYTIDFFLNFANPAYFPGTSIPNETEEGTINQTNKSRGKFTEVGLMQMIGYITSNQICKNEAFSFYIPFFV